jgi:hypothetical protein
VNYKDQRIVCEEFSARIEVEEYSASFSTEPHRRTGRKWWMGIIDVDTRALSLNVALYNRISKGNEMPLNMPQKPPSNHTDLEA